MDAKIACEILRDTIIQFSPNPYRIKPISIDRANDIANLIESLAAKAELVDAASKIVDSLDCQGKFDESECGEDAIECECVDFCRLRAGRKQG